jgi:aminobenzoyl-glutamate utilization protein B
MKGMLVAARTLSLGAIELFEKPDELKAARAAFDKRLAGRKWVTKITPDSKPRLDYAGK